MSKFTITALVAAACVLGACANKSDSGVEEEFVVVVPEPITTEPTYTGKYK